MLPPDADRTYSDRVQIYVMRHGIAVDRERESARVDAERPLTARGTRRVRGVARGLAALDVTPELIVTSPLRRARQTAERVAAELGIDAKRLQISRALAPAASSATLLRELAALEVESVLCVGHAPGVDLLIARAVAGVREPITRLKKAAVACVELGPSGRRGRLVWLLEPAVLRRLGRSGG